VIAMAAAGVRFLAHSGGAISTPSPASIIYGKARESFVREGIKSCTTKQENDPETKALALSKDKLEKYCSCYMNALADATTYGDLQELVKEGPNTPAMHKKVDAASASCVDWLRRNLLGG